MPAAVGALVALETRPLHRGTAYSGSWPECVAPFRPLKIKFADYSDTATISTCNPFTNAGTLSAVTKIAC